MYDSGRSAEGKFFTLTKWSKKLNSSKLGERGVGVRDPPPQEGGWVVWDTPSQPPTVAQMPFPKVSVQGATGTTMTRAFLNDPLGGVQPPVAKKVAGWKEGAD